MSMLRIRVGFLGWGLWLVEAEVISCCRRVMRTGFVPVVRRPHLEAKVLRCVSLRVVGRVKLAIHVVVSLVLALYI